MVIIATDQWVKQYLARKSGTPDTDFSLQRDLLCNPLKRFFPNAKLKEIHDHLIGNGLFLPGTSDQDIIKRLLNGPYWEKAAKEMKQLKQEWSGPAVSVFILPVTLNNEQLRADFQGKSGLAHRHAIFLFVSGDTSEKAFQALLTHEYNHVCRLSALNQEEHDLTLLDTMVMEGLAEAAVAERVGIDYQAPWTAAYSRTDAASHWEQWIRPYQHIKKTEFYHQYIMYGGGHLPKWLGYHTGFQLVQSFLENNKTSIKELLHLSAKEIFDGSFLAEN